MRRLLAAAVLSLGAWGSMAEVPSVLAGHGGPIMGLAVEGSRVLSASFDNSVGVWSLAAPAAPRWLEGHRAAVNAVAFVGDNRAASGGDDAMAVLWDLSSGQALHRMEGHSAKIMGIAASADGQRLATASWDWTVGVWDTETGALIQQLEGHDSGVNAVAFGPDDRLYSVSGDGTLREWSLTSGKMTRILVRHGFGINRVLVDPAGRWIAYGALDGGTRVLDLDTEAEIANLTAGRKPILAMSHAGGQLAVGDGEGHIMVVDTEGWQVIRDFRAAKHGPIWALAHAGDDLIAGGIADTAHVFALGDGPDQTAIAETRRAFHTDPQSVDNGARQFLRKCSICHTLTGDGARKAGPTLAGLFGRRAGTVAGYRYSLAMQGSEIVWNADTIDKLFDLGPDHYTPGSKMPMQRITSADDRADLIAFLRRETQP